MKLIKGEKYFHRTMKWEGIYTGSDELDYNHDFYITKSSELDCKTAKKGELFEMNTGCLHWLVPKN